MIANAVLVADDDADFRELMHLMIEAWEATVLEAVNFEQAVDIARSERARIGLVLLDYFMPGDRQAAARSLRELFGEENVFLCTACGDASMRATELGLSRVLSKPVDMDLFQQLVRKVARPRRTA